MHQTTIETAQLGVMQFVPRSKNYQTVAYTLFPNPIRFLIDAEDVDAGLPRLERFAVWLETNHQAFKGPLEYQIKNYDLVWDDVWDEILGADWVHRPAGFLADHLTYSSVEYISGKLFVWVETGGLHTTHMVRATVNERMEIELCEML